MEARSETDERVLLVEAVTERRRLVANDVVELSLSLSLTSCCMDVPRSDDGVWIAHDAVVVLDVDQIVGRVLDGLVAPVDLEIANLARHPIGSPVVAVHVDVGVRVAVEPVVPDDALPLCRQRLKEVAEIVVAAGDDDGGHAHGAHHSRAPPPAPRREGTGSGRSGAAN